MNYLSHFYFDQHDPDPYYILGIALPDLVKNHQRRWNIHPEKHKEALLANPLTASILKGWERHVQVDKLFHESKFFNEKSTYISERIRETPLSHKKVKSFMIGHVGLELILDTLLSTRSQIYTPKFYQQLEKCDPSVILEFLIINKIEDPESFIPFYERFCTVQYLLSYQNNESIVYALNRIQFRLTGEYFSDTDIVLLNNNFENIIEMLENDYLSIFDEIREKLNT